MATFTEPPPAPLPTTVRRFNPDGTPTQAQIDYDAAFQQWLKRLAAAIT